MKTNLFLFALLVCYFSTGYVPNLSAIDKMATQFLYLSTLNTIGLLYFIYDKKETFFLNKYSFITFLCFTAWALSSFIYAFNQEEVIIYVNKFFVFFISSIIIYSTLKELDLKNKKFVLLIITALIIEIVWINFIFFDRFIIAAGRDMGLRAFTGNINITGIALIFKIPFLIYGINEFKGLLKKFLIFLLPVAIFTILLMGSRLVNLLIIALLIGFIVYSILSKGQIINRKTLFLFGFSIILALFLNNAIFKESSINAVERSTNIFTNSTDQRIRFYKQALGHLLNNPLFGTGAGNWKIQSLIYDNEYISDYTVPYHVHNDYLQTAAELGIVGFFLRYSLYFIILFLLTKIFKSIIKGDKLLLYLFAPFLIFLIDSFLNFPHDRPIILILFEIILSSIFLKLEGLNFFKGYKISRVFIYCLLFLSIPSSYLSFLYYQSYKNQNDLIVGMIQDSYYLSEDEIYNMNSKIPSISATTIPMEIYKANYLFNKGHLNDSMFYMVDVGTSKNPHLFTGMSVKSVFHLRKKNIDSAKFYAKKAFEGLPDNSVHFNLYSDILAATKDSIGLKKAYNYFKKPIRKEFTEKYLKHINSIKQNFDSDDSLLIDEIYKNKGINNLGDALNIINQVGKENVFKAVEIASEAELKFNESNYLDAAKLFEEAIKFNPKEIAYYDNAANSYMKFGDNIKAIKLLLKAFKKLETTGKTEYLLSILFYDENEKEKSCLYLNKSKEKGFFTPKGLETIFCQKEYY